MSTGGVFTLFSESAPDKYPREWFALNVIVNPGCGSVLQEHTRMIDSRTYRSDFIFTLIVSILLTYI